MVQTRSDIHLHCSDRSRFNRAFKKIQPKITIGLSSNVCLLSCQILKHLMSVMYYINIVCVRLQNRLR